ncbi:MAG TPA: zinc ribbon domain-containing protein [Ktedonobacteraceae bacterium]|jgi:putative FmdB family regulatory protein|nr:zinc ribbon domain-containing protein [Ktedonobacteraceae bacterium]
MPTYEYLCRECSHRFETRQKMTDDSLTTCPECGGNIRRVLFPASVVFKGSGFYKTDHNGSSAVVNENGTTDKTEKTESSKEGETKTASESKTNESSTQAPATKTNDNKVTANTK